MLFEAHPTCRSSATSSLWRWVFDMPAVKSELAALTPVRLRPPSHYAAFIAGRGRERLLRGFRSGKCS